MAWYPPEFVERIQLIKELQERRFMPLKAIKGMLDLEGEATRISAAELKRRYAVPQEVLDRLAELEVIAPNSRGYGASDVRIVEAISRFRAGGYDERIGFTVYDTLRYKRAMEELVKEEVEVIMERLGGEADAQRAQLIETGRGAAARPDLGAAHEGARRRAEAAARRTRVIRRARPEDVPGIAAAMGAAFEDDPVASWFWRKPNGRREYIAGWYALVAREHYLDHGEVFVAEEDGEIVGCSMWSPPGGWRFSPRVEMQTTRYVAAAARPARADREHRDAADRARAPDAPSTGTCPSSASAPRARGAATARS